MKEEFFEGAGGIKLFGRWWRPEGRPRGLVTVMHGFKSHSGLYGWVAEQLVACGFAVSAFDMRGHGRSEGERLFVQKFSEYVDDLATSVALSKSREPGVPTFVLGHSAGGVVSTLYALDHQDEISGLVCESFAQELPAPDFALAILKGVGNIAPHAHVLKLKDEDFSRDPVFVERMKSDPLIPKFGYPAETAAELVRADERLKRDFSKITLPVLILHGSADAAAKPHGSQHFYEATSSTDKTLELYEGHFHDLLNDVGKEEVMGDISSWLVARA